jgi:RNA polymerase sigma-70 factor, ECF subfamily
VLLTNCRKGQRRLQSPSSDPEAALQQKDRGELLRQALIHLSREHREIIDLVYYHERSIAECAEIIGIPPATLKTRHLAKQDGLAGKTAREEQ